MLQEGKYRALPDHVTKVVAVTHDRDHYAVMEIDIPMKKAIMYADFTGSSTNGWIML
jgi:hypothetical protein